MSQIDKVREEARRLAETNKPLPPPSSTQPYQQREAQVAAYFDTKRKEQK